MLLTKNGTKSKKYILGIFIFFIIIGVINEEESEAKRITRLNVIPNFTLIKKFNNRAHMEKGKWIPDLLTWVHPELRIDYKALRIPIVTSVSVDSMWYFSKERPDFNNVTHNIRLNNNYVENRRLSFLLNINFSKITETAKGEVAIMPEIIETRIKEMKDFNTSSAVNYFFSERTTGFLEVGGNKTEFKVIAGQSPKGDSVKSRTSGRLSHIISPRTDIGIGGEYTKRDYEGLDGDYKKIGIYYGYKFTPNAKLSFEWERFKVNYKEKAYQIDNYYGNNINAEVAFNVADLGKGSFRYYKSYNATDFIDNLTKQSEISARVGRRIFPKTYIFFWTGRRKNDYKGMIDRDLVKWERYWAFSVGINYSWHRWLSPTVLPFMTKTDFNFRYDFIDNHFTDNRTPEPEGRLQNHMLNFKIVTYH